MFLQAFERGDNINSLADKTESLRDQVNKPTKPRQFHNRYDIDPRINLNQEFLDIDRRRRTEDKELN